MPETCYSSSIINFSFLLCYDKGIEMGKVSRSTMFSHFVISTSFGHYWMWHMELHGRYFIWCFKWTNMITYIYWSLYPFHGLHWPTKSQCKFPKKFGIPLCWDLLSNTDFFLEILGHWHCKEIIFGYISIHV